jgi:RIO-like serine/threonine protein kinase
MRRQQKLVPPDENAWAYQMYKIWVFDQLIDDADVNLTNILITEDWKIWRIDFSRAFRLSHDLQAPKDLVKCDRQLLQKLRMLDGKEVLEKTKPHLNKNEVAAVMARRDKIVAHFDQLIAQKGEAAVLD